jgi:anti-anti-sigma regulatory factor
MLAGGRQGADFRAALTSALHPEAGAAGACVIVDLAEVTAVDDEVLRALVWAAGELERSRRELVIAGARDTVESLIRLTRVDRKIRLFQTAAGAEAAVAG